MSQGPTRFRNFLHDEKQGNTMLHLHVFKKGDTLYCEGHTNKEYKWEGDSDFADIDIPADSWEQLLERMEWAGITEMSVLTFADGTEMTLAEFRPLINTKTLEYHLTKN